MGGYLACIGPGTALFWVSVSVLSAVVCFLVLAIMRNRKANRLLREPGLKALQFARNSDSQLDEIGQILADTGYAYDPEQNIYYSVLNPWQRGLGYFSLYDEWATPLGMVFDCEPVCFNYGGKRWLIELWKGQYGITVGGEIGVYNTVRPDLDIPGVFKGAYYQSAEDDETLNMMFTLRKNGAALFNRADRQWWLTGFVLGEYSDPSMLTMDACVTLRDAEMRDAFLAALQNLGYTGEDIRQSGNTVQFTFAKPRSKQPAMRRGPVKFVAMQWNKSLVMQYKELTKEFSGMYDILMTLKVKSPALYRLATHIARQRELFKAYEKIKDYLT